jgi:hypothetical protein
LNNKITNLGILFDCGHVQLIPFDLSEHEEGTANVMLAYCPWCTSLMRRMKSYIVMIQGETVTTIRTEKNNVLMTYEKMQGDEKCLETPKQTFHYKNVKV